MAVSDVTSLSGTWEGTVYLPGSERDDVTLTVRDDGSYEVVSKRGLAVSSGRGHIVISDGRLVIEDARGRGVGTVLRSPAGDVLVKVDLTLSDNSHLSAQLWRTSPARGGADSHVGSTPRISATPLRTSRIVVRSPRPPL